MFRFWFVPVGFVTAIAGALVLRRVVRSMRRSGLPAQPQVMAAPPPPSTIDLNVQAELDELENRFRE